MQGLVLEESVSVCLLSSCSQAPELQRAFKLAGKISAEDKSG
jgi:hypothetical protein